MQAMRSETLPKIAFPEQQSDFGTSNSYELSTKNKLRIIQVLHDFFTSIQSARIQNRPYSSHVLQNLWSI